MGDYLDDYNKWLENLIEYYKTIYQKIIDETIKETYFEYYKFYEKKITEIFNVVIDNFYKYKAKVYTKKRGSLYKILRIEYDADHFTAGFESSELKYRDGSTGKDDSLYTTLFRDGYHGGANMRGRYVYPYRYNTETDSYSLYDGEYNDETRITAPWKNKKSKGQIQGWVPAEKEDEAPLDAINRMITQTNNEAQEFYEQTYARIRKEKEEKYLKQGGK